MAKEPRSRKLQPKLKAAENEKWELELAFQLRLHKLDKLFAREYIVPELGRQWRWDFADPVNKVLLEVQGGIWMKKGAHNTGLAIIRDNEKSNTAQLHGWRVFCFTEGPIKKGEAIKLIATYYANLPKATQSCPAAADTLQSLL